MRIPFIASLAALAVCGSTYAQVVAPPLKAADYVMKAGQSDQFEIQTGRLASTKGSSAAVRSFGAQMVTDHTKSTAMIASAANRQGTPPTPPPPLDPNQQAMLTELQGLDGAAFDKDYITQQTTAHQQALALHSGYARNGDNASLKAVANQIVPVVQMHLDMLQKMH